MVVLALSLLTRTLTLNPGGGGTGPTSGLKIVIGDTGQIQVHRQGYRQLYPDNEDAQDATDTDVANGIYLAQGATITGPTHARLVMSRNGFIMTVDYRYTAPSPALSITWTLQIPANAATLRVYMAYDTWLGNPLRAPIADPWDVDHGLHFLRADEVGTWD